MSKNLFLTKKLIEDKSLSDESICVIAALRNIICDGIDEYYITYGMIAYYLFQRLATKREMECVKKGFNDLVDKELVIIKNKYISTEFICDLSKLYHKHNSSFFSDVTDDELHAIMNIKKNNCNKYKIFRYFSCMVGSFNRSNSISKQFRGKIGGLSLKDFSNMLKISVHTMSEYNKILEENKLLFVIRHKDFYQEFTSTGKSKLKEISNTYSRFCDKELAILYSSTIYGYKYNNHEKDIKTNTANSKRGLAQKYISFCKGKQYDIDTIKKLYEYCIEWNAAQESKYKEELSKGYSPAEPKYKNIDVFDRYLKYIKD